MHLISPPHGSTTREYGVLRTFADERERDEFYRSDLFERWQKHVAQLTEGERTYRELHSLEAWFHTLGAPPQWKMALLTWLGVWPTSWLVGALIGPPLAGFSNSFKLSDCRCRHCRLPHVVGYAGAGEGFSFLASLTNRFMGGEYV